MITFALLACLSVRSNQRTNNWVDISVDLHKQKRISPYIYGVNYPDTWINDWLTEWDQHPAGFTMAREGGNRFSAYNWVTNASNAGNDYHFENDDYLATTNEPGWTVRKFLSYVQSKNAAALITVPTIGHVSSDKDTGRDGGMDVNHTPDYIHKRFKPSVAHKPGGHLSLTPDANAPAVYEDEFVNWVEHVKSKRSPVWFSLDNEPDLWNGTHQRIRPNLPTYAEIIANNLEYASMVKDIAPDSLVFGPANYGWGGFRNFQGASDGKGRIFVDAYLKAMRDAEKRQHRRLVDVYDFHWYPEATGDGIRIVYTSAPDKPGTAIARIQAPRSLWDPTYVEKSWITDNLGQKPIALLPDMYSRVLKNYPGTKLSISEYDFGGRKTISGALAEADALGVFGRFGLFAACHWGLTHDDEAAFAGFQAFTNYDRHGSRFGDTGLAVRGEDPNQNSIYASLDSHDKSRLTIVIVNKVNKVQALRISTKGFPARNLSDFVVKEGSYLEPIKGSARLVRDAVEVESDPLSITTLELRSR